LGERFLQSSFFRREFGEFPLIKINSDVVIDFVFVEPVYTSSRLLKE
jgi:hypothetical protein